MLLLVLALLLPWQANASKPGGKRKAAPSRSEQVRQAPDPATGHAALVRGDYSQAIGLYSHLLSSSGLSPTQRQSIHVSRAYAFLGMNRKAEATTDLRRAVALNPADTDAADALVALETSGPSKDGAVTLNPSRPQGWGLLSRLPGKNWILTNKKASLYLRYEWSAVGIRMLFGGRDPRGNRIEGQYFVDPGTNMIRSTYTYRGRVISSSINVTADQFIESISGKPGEREVTEAQADGTLKVLTEKLKGATWKEASVAAFVPASDQMVATLNWPEEATPKESFGRGLLKSLKEGALAGFKEGTANGLNDAVQYRVRQVTDTKQCENLSGEIVKCP
jgi:hypothetical protein